MIDWIKTDLIEFLISEEGKNNDFAKRLYNLIDSGKFYSSSREELANIILSEKTPNLDLKEENNIPTEVANLRFKHLLLKNVKKYPDSPIPYGISFSRDNKPVSTIFLGDNGVGKTSLYAALEYAGLGKLDTALIRGYERVIGENVDVTGEEENSQEEFLLHLDCKKSDLYIKILTASGAIEIDGVNGRQKPLVADAFYCSDYDVRQLEATDDYTNFFLNQIGFAEYYQCLQFIYYLQLFAQKKKSELEEENLSFSRMEKDEAFERFKLGLSLGNFHISENLYESLNNELNIVDAIEKFIDNQEETSSTSIEKTIKILKEESYFFQLNNWFLKEIGIQFLKSIKILSAIYKTANQFYPKIDFEFLNRFEFLRLRIRECIHHYNEEVNFPDFIPKSLKGFYSWKNSKEKFESKQKAYPLLSDKLLYNEFKRHYLEIQSYLEFKLSSHLEELMPSIEDAIYKLLNGYFTEERDDIEISLRKVPFDNNSVFPNYNNLFNKKVSVVWPFLQFKIVIKSSGGLVSDKLTDINPRAYLNTFKYKLFIVAFKLACSCVAKKIYKINYPLIIDDVFDSSDFNNRVGLKDFICSLFEQHNKFLSDEQFQLQLIFFTQDNLIADQVEKGINSYYLNCKNKNSRIGKAKLSRIYDYHEINPKKDFFTDSNNKVQSKKKDIKPLYYSIDDCIS